MRWLDDYVLMRRRADKTGPEARQRGRAEYSPGLAKREQATNFSFTGLFRVYFDAFSIFDVYTNL